ncbi:hypothetical protein HGO34_06940 [Agrobacterium vitis]|uniref:Uncharacterized protein n=1 Tax=Agrobacterium vitis TaxID=373 RepID=A0AAE4WBY4_AGRVI|nr:DUF6152 family protein [Agrobacterium vitis]MCF1499301.1 hypothetical protein [Allorhizobium sp. Av2]MCM2439451.1 hypothetical protein [Agrobacterium vitis]MUZ57648.1 hypothetical protein [Agrobacterium vitis]
MKLFRYIAVTMMLTASPTQAHHGWGFYATDRPIYLSGKITAVVWRNPHPEIVIDVLSAAIPASLAQLPVPVELRELGFDEVLAKTAAPETIGEWTLDLAPINRSMSWGMPRVPKVGDEIQAVAFPSCSEKNVSRPALIVIDGIGVRQQSVALPAGCSGLPRG